MGTSSGGKGGGQSFDPKMGTAQSLNQGLADQFGYTGSFGAGGFDAFRQAQDPQTQAAITGYINNYQPPNTLATNTMQGLGDAGRQTQEWMDYTPQQLSQTNLDPYMNPYQQNVIDATMSEMQRQNEFQQDRLGDMAQQAGAFGGDRHGVAEAEMNRNFADQQQRWLANMNAQNFNQAQQGAQFDIGGQFQNKAMGMGGANQLGGLANMGFGWGQNIQDQQRQAGMDQFAQEQAVIDNAMRQWQMYQEQPYKNLSILTGSLPGSGGAGTTSSTPGLMDYLGLGSQLGGGWLLGG